MSLPAWSSETLTGPITDCERYGTEPDGLHGVGDADLPASVADRAPVIDSGPRSTARFPLAALVGFRPSTVCLNRARQHGTLLAAGTNPVSWRQLVDVAGGLAAAARPPGAREHARDSQCVRVACVSVSSEAVVGGLLDRFVQRTGLVEV